MPRANRCWFNLSIVIRIFNHMAQTQFSNWKWLMFFEKRWQDERWRSVYQPIYSHNIKNVSNWCIPEQLFPGWKFDRFLLLFLENFLRGFENLLKYYLKRIFRQPWIVSFAMNRISRFVNTATWLVHVQNIKTFIVLRIVSVYAVVARLSPITQIVFYPD